MFARQVARVTRTRIDTARNRRYELVASKRQRGRGRFSFSLPGVNASSRNNGCNRMDVRGARLYRLGKGPLETRNAKQRHEAAQTSSRAHDPSILSPRPAIQFSCESKQLLLFAGATPAERDASVHHSPPIVPVTVDISITINTASTVASYPTPVRVVIGIPKT